MTTQQNVGPAELRRIADALDEQSAVFSSAGWIVITNTTDVRQQAAAWDANLAALEQARALLAEAFPLNVVVLGDPDNQDLRNRVRAFLLSAEGGAA